MRRENLSQFDFSCVCLNLFLEFRRMFHFAFISNNRRAHRQTLAQRSKIMQPRALPWFFFQPLLPRSRI